MTRTFRFPCSSHEPSILVYLRELASLSTPSVEAFSAVCDGHKMILTVTGTPKEIDFIDYLINHVEQ